VYKVAVSWAEKVSLGVCVWILEKLNSFIMHLGKE